MAEFWLIGIERVLASIERCEIEVTVLCRSGVELGAGCLVVQDNGDSRKRSGMEIREPTRERAGERGLDVDSMDGARRDWNELPK